MPSRTISTKVAIEGESQYRQAVSALNSSLKTLSTELAKVESQYRNQANSMEALKAKGDVVTKLYDEQRAKVNTLKDALANAKKAQQEHTQHVEDAKAKIAAAEKELSEMTDTTEEAAKRQTELTEQIEKLNKEMEYEQAAADAAQKGVNSWQQQLNRAEVSLDDLNEDLRKNEQYLEEASKSADGCATSIDKYGREVKDAGDESEKFGEKSKDAVEALAQALAAAGIVESLEKIVETLHACVDASIEYESAFAGVQKTVNATDEELAAISDGIKNLSTVIPASTTELNGVAEAAGQLGIKTGDILDFTEVMTNLGVTTNLSADEAASALAKFANVVKMSAEDYGRLGSTIVDLGNNFATTEADIVGMATRLASTGEVVGLTEAQIMAVATALSSLGIEAEAGGSAISKLLKQIETSVQTYDQANSVIKQTGMTLRDLELFADADSKGFKELAQSLGFTSTELKGFMSSAKNMENFSKVAGVSAQEFQQAWGKDAVRALDMFISGLGSVDQAGGSAVAVLEEMGLTEIRLSNAVLSMASSGGILTEALDLANAAWDENIALTKEAETRYGTTESKIQLFKNSVELLKVAIGDELTPAIAEMAETGTDIVEWATKMIEENEDLVPVVAAVTAALGAGALGITGYMTVTKLVIPTILKFNAALSANPAGLVVMSVAALTGAIAALAITTGGAESEVSKYSEAIKESKAAHEDAIAIIEEERASATELADSIIELSEKEHKNTTEKEMLLSMVEELNAAVPELSLAYDEQTDSLNMTAESLRALVEAQYEYEAQQENVERYRELYAELREGSELLADAQRRVEEAQRAYDDAIKEADPSLVGYSGTLEMLASDLAAAQQEYDALTAAQAGTKAEMEQLEGVIDDYNQKTTEASTANTDLESSFGDLTAELTTRMQELQDAYSETYNKAYESITQQMGLLSELDNTAKTEVGEIIDALQSQIDFMNEYAENMNKAVEMGVDEGLVRQLSDGSVESAEILRGIVEDGGKNIDELNEKFRKVEEGKQDFARELTDMQIEFSEKMDMIKSDMDSLVAEMDQYQAAAQAGSRTIEGYISGLRSKMDTLRQLEGELSIGFDTRISTRAVDGTHAGGLAYVPYDGYIAELHKGERVLTAAEAQAFIDNAIPDVPSSVYSTTNNSADNRRIVTIGDIHVHVTGDTESVMEAISETTAEEIERKLRYKGVL